MVPSLILNQLIKNDLDLFLLDTVAVAAVAGVALIYIRIDYFQDGIKWHDVACYHTKPFICEDSDKLLQYVRDTNEGIKL